MANVNAQQVKGKQALYANNMQKGVSDAQNILANSAKRVESALHDFLKQKNDGGRALKTKHLKKGYNLISQIEKHEAAEKGTESFIDYAASGNYMTGTGAGPIDGMGPIATSPSISSKVAKRVLSESTFLGDIVEFQPMSSLTGMILAIRMTSGRFGEAGLDDLNYEVGRTLNNFIQAGGFKMMMQASLTDIEEITANGNVTIGKVSYNFTVATVAGENEGDADIVTGITAVSTGAASGTGDTAVTAATATQVAEMSALVVGKGITKITTASIDKCRLVDGGFKEALSIKSVDGDGVYGLQDAGTTNVIIGIEPNMAINKTIVVGDTAAVLSIDYLGLVNYIKSQAKATPTGGFPTNIPMYPGRENVSHRRQGQFYYALNQEEKNILSSGSLDDVVSAEVYIKGKLNTGFGLTPGYALTLGSYGEDVDPNRNINDLATGAFTGVGMDANGNFTFNTYEEMFNGNADSETASVLGGANSILHQLQPRIKTKSFTASERATSTTIIRNIEEDVAKAIGIDYQGIIVEQMKKLIVETMDLEILNHMKLTSLNPKEGGCAPKLFNFMPASSTGWPEGNEVQGLWLQQKITTLITALVERGENIHKATNKAGRGDFGIVTPLTAALLVSGGSIYNNFDIKDTRANNSPKIGNIAGYEVFTDVWGEMNDVQTGKFTGFSQMLVGMKAKGIGESGVFVGMYRPVTVDGPVQGFQHHNKSLLVTTRYGVVSGNLDAGSYYRLVMANGIEQAIYGYAA